MSLENSLIYIDESLRLCKELAAFLKKRQSFEMEYAKDMAKLSHGLQSFQSDGAQKEKKQDSIRSHILVSSLWQSYSEKLDQANAIAGSHVCIL